MENKNRAERFLQVYAEIDTYMRKSLRHQMMVPHHSLIDEMAVKHRRFDQYRFDLHTFARLRNAIVHNPYGDKADPIAEPHVAVVEHYEAIIKHLINPISALDKSTPADKIFMTSLTDNAKEVMQTMRLKRYKYVPVVYKNHMIGVFSENVVFSYLTEQGAGINDNTKIDLFRDYMGFEAHSSEYFEFVSVNTPFDDIEALFARTFKDTKRLAVVYITKKGSYKEPLLGMLTAWDVLGQKN